MIFLFLNKNTGKFHAFKTENDFMVVSESIKFEFEHRVLNGQNEIFSLSNSIYRAFICHPYNKNLLCEIPKMANS